MARRRCCRAALSMKPGTCSRAFNNCAQCAVYVRFITPMRCRRGVCTPTAKCGMSGLRSALCALALMAAAVPAGAQQARYGLGRGPTPQEVGAWDIDVRPDGHGLKAGRGTVAQGQKIYDAQCASCHGTFGESNRY